MQGLSSAGWGSKLEFTSQIAYNGSLGIAIYDA